MKKMLLGSLAAIVIMLAGCDDIQTVPTTQSTTEEQSTDFQPMVSATGQAIDGQTLKIAQASEGDFTGTLSSVFSQNTVDSQFFEPANESLFYYDENLRLIDGGAASIDFDEKNKQVRITLKADVRWNDGTRVTAADLIFPYEVIGHPDYQGVRYDASKQNIVGMEEYHTGKASTISGIEKVNDKEILIRFKEITPAILQGGGSIWSDAMPKHTFEGIPVKEMANSEPVRKQPITFGPYYVSKINGKDSVEYTPNPYYYGKKPSLAKIVMTKIPVSAAVPSLQAKEHDIYMDMPAAEYSSWQAIDGYENIGQLRTAYNYLGFRLGYWDEKANKNMMDANAKMGDKRLRQALGYAIDNQTIANRLYNGLQIRANSLIVPTFSTLHDEKFAGFDYNPTKAKKLLDEAGYKDVDEDGVREDPDGKPFTIQFALREGGDTAEALANFYLQQWEKVGLDVRLATGKLIEATTFSEMLNNNDERIDMYSAGWSTGYNPDQTNFFGETNRFNYTHFVSEENNQLLAAMTSSQALDEKKAKEVYQKWQQYAFDQAFAIPTTYVYQVYPVSERVINYDLSYTATQNRYATVGVIKEER